MLKLPAFVSLESDYSARNLRDEPLNVSINRAQLLRLRSPHCLPHDGDILVGGCVRIIIYLDPLQGSDWLTSMVKPSGGS